MCEAIMKKILLVEDETHVVSFIKKGLTEESFDVTVAFDGSTGLQLFASNYFDLVILDIMLPDKNGLEVCREIRKTNHSIPVLFLTYEKLLKSISSHFNSAKSVKFMPRQ